MSDDLDALRGALTAIAAKPADAFWVLREAETSAAFRSELTKLGYWCNDVSEPTPHGYVNTASWPRARAAAMSALIHTHHLGKPEHYELFMAACERLGESDVKAMGVAAALMNQRSYLVRRAWPPCPECQSHDVAKTQGQWNCKDCGRLYGAKK